MAEVKQAEAPKKEREKAIGVFKLSNKGRKYQVAGFEEGKSIDVLAGVITQVPESAAAYLLGKLSNGAKRFPDLIGADAMSPEATKAKNDAIAENKSLKEQNAALLKQLEDLNKASEDNKKGGKNK